jgi:hypothetical protein
VVAEMGKKIRRLGKGAAAGEVNGVTQENPPVCAVRPFLAAKPLRNCCAAVVKMAFTKKRRASQPRAALPQKRPWTDAPNSPRPGA